MKIKEKFTNEISIFGDTVLIEGKIYGEGDFRIDGRILGDLDIKGNLTLGERAYIQGNIKCINLNLAGRVEGNIITQEKLVLEKTSNLKGNIDTRQLIVEPGAIINGVCSMSEKSDIDEKI